MPRGTEGEYCSSCDVNFDVMASAGMSSYFNWQSQSITAGGGLFDFSFHASKSWQDMQATMQAQQSIVTETLAQCCVYNVLLALDAPPPIDDNFAARVASFDGSQQACYELFDDFGTHVVVEMSMGSMFGQRFVPWLCRCPSALSGR
jgi:hypothetical protein